jgi:hypothetical protein
MGDAKFLRIYVVFDALMCVCVWLHAFVNDDIYGPLRIYGFDVTNMFSLKPNGNKMSRVGSE